MTVSAKSRLINLVGVKLFMAVFGIITFICKLFPEMKKKNICFSALKTWDMELFSSCVDIRLPHSAVLVEGESSCLQSTHYGPFLHKMRVFHRAQKYREAGMKTENRSQFTWWPKLR